MRPEVRAFAADGPLPDWDTEEAEIDRRAGQIEAIPRPVTVGEAAALADCFGPDDCYGVAWTLLHLIETGPGPAVTVRPDPATDEWRHRLWRRAVNGGLLPGEPGDDG
ncbi:hypothetical protein GCM10009759_37010 [Kitasatospora saccharophila]|uniref:Uncharacterized protein n=1 Tax=Kitasatospora saccharophila TaxID=407973 RepID=A0ABP5IP76_9ACTN